MSRSAARACAGRDRPSLYQEITDKIIAELEAGRVPCVQPWGTVQAKASLTMPRNATTQRQYSGINVLILWGAVIEHGFSAQNWLTFRQALGLGGSVRKGEHGITVVYADRFVPDEERRAGGTRRRRAQHDSLPQTVYGLQHRPVRKSPSGTDERSHTSSRGAYPAARRGADASAATRTEYGLIAAGVAFAAILAALPPSMPAHLIALLLLLPALGAATLWLE